MADTLVEVSDLVVEQDNPDCLFFDCRFNLLDVAWGRGEYHKGHIPGAVYVDLNKDLSAAVVPGKTGRHPLPSIELFQQQVAKWGITQDTQIIIYDQREGMFAARLWWMLRWCGIKNVALLNGGWSAWLAAGASVSTDQRKQRSINNISLAVNEELIVNADDVMNNLESKELILLDARTEDRYRGENETIDPIAGHIPGALSAPFVLNLDKDGKFLSKNDLNDRYKKLLGDRAVSDVVNYCGSGVTATHNIFAMYYAGLGMASLYPGSWSEWITDERRPIALGAI